MILIASLQYPLWLGKGSWLRVWDLNRQIQDQKKVNVELKARNEQADAEVRDLKQGFAAIEERARSELGMVKQDEVFYQVLKTDIIGPPPSVPEVPHGASPLTNQTPKTNDISKVNETPKKTPLASHAD